MDNERYSTADYAKLFLLMVIPAYGLFFTVLLAFSKEVTGELKCLARGALIARVTLLIFLCILIGIIFYVFLPNINNWLSTIDILRFMR